MKNRKGNYDILSGFDFFVPDIKKIIIFTLWFLLGVVLTVVFATLSMLCGWRLPMIDMQIIAMAIQYLPPMMYALAVSRQGAFMHKEDEPRPKIDSLKKSSLNTVLLVVMAVVATLAAASLMEGIAPLLPELNPTMFKTVQELFLNSPTVPVVIMTVIMAPFFEELIFRGFICRGIASHYGKVWGILISALLFGLVHGNVTQGIPAAVLGVVFGYVYLRTGSLKLTMAMHAVNNAVSVTTMKCFADKMDLNLYTDILAPWQAVTLLCAAAVIVVIFIDVVRRNYNTGSVL